MKSIVGFLCILFVCALPVFAESLLPQQEELQLLVLSEIEEHIAGRMAFYVVEQKFAERGYTITADPRISRIGRAVTKYSDRVQLRYSFYVIEGDVVPQSLSLPGGYVFVSRSLLQKVCRTDDDIAFVLGHEIAHSALRHYADYKLQGTQQIAYVKRLIQQHDLLEEEEKPKYAEELHGILFPYLMKIRRIKEMEADQFGALYALRAGYQFSAGIRVLGRLGNLYGETFQLEKDLFSSDELPLSDAGTHPKISERIEQLELFRIKAVEVSKLFPQGREALDLGDHETASLVFEMILSIFPQSRAAHIGLGAAYHIQFWQSVPSDDFLLAYPGELEIERLPIRPPRIPNWDALYRAIEEYRRVLAMEPGNKYAANNLGVALAELNQLEEAENVLRESLRLDTQDFVLFNLALVLHQKYQETQQPELKQEAVALIKQYLRLMPHDQVAVEYLGELE